MGQSCGISVRDGSGSADLDRRQRHGRMDAQHDRLRICSVEHFHAVPLGKERGRSRE